MAEEINCKDLENGERIEVIEEKCVEIRLNNGEFDDELVGKYIKILFYFLSKIRIIYLFIIRNYELVFHWESAIAPKPLGTFPVKCQLPL